MKPDDLDLIREVIKEEIAEADLAVINNLDVDSDTKTRLDEIEREVRELSDKVDIVLGILTEEKGDPE